MLRNSKGRLLTNFLIVALDRCMYAGPHQPVLTSSVICDVNTALTHPPLLQLSQLFLRVDLQQFYRSVTQTGAINSYHRIPSLVISNNLTTFAKTYFLNGKKSSREISLARNRHLRSNASIEL